MKNFVILDSYGTIVGAAQDKKTANARAAELDNAEKGIFHTVHRAEITGISVFGRLHTDRYYTTYHTASIAVFFKGGKVYKHKTPEKYGYSDAYLDTAYDHLRKNGFLPESSFDLPRFCRENGICFTCDRVYVSRAKDL